MSEDNKIQNPDSIIKKIDFGMGMMIGGTDIKNIITGQNLEVGNLVDNINTKKISKAGKKELYDILSSNKDEIISKWNNDSDFIGFCEKFSININEVVNSLDYFGGYKIMNYIFKGLTEEKLPESDSYVFISTKFLDFIKGKGLGVEDLLRITSILKHIIVSDYLNDDVKMINYINDLFDRIAANLSKNYNDIIIKILAEYTNAINSSNIITKTDIYGRITSANDEFCKLSGSTREELIGQNHNIVRHPDMPKKVFKELWETIQDKRIWKGIIKNRKKDGGSYRVQATIAPILGENDKIIEYISIRTDITELKETYKNLEEYSNALNEASMVLKLDEGGKIIDVNETFLAMAGYRKADIIGKTYAPEVIWINKNSQEGCKIPILTKEQWTEINEYIEEKQTWKGIIKNIGKYGNYFWTSTNIIPILGLNNEIIEYIILQNDVTDLEIAKQKFKAALTKQKEVDVKKDEFLNIASHELRTPMTSIKGYLSMILDGDAGEINPEVRQYLEQVYKSSDRLLMLINDMLDLSKIESGKQELTYEKVEISNLIRETCNEMKTLFENKKQKLEIIIDFEKFEYNTDTNKLKQVLLNILGNANKFTGEEGKVTIHAEVTQAQLIIKIKDSGIGIAEENFHKIFEKFGQVRNSLTRDISGTGLGLPIARTIIEKMGGYIGISSEIGKGTEFSINLPVNNI